MYELKTKETESSISNFIERLEDEVQRKDSGILIEMIEKITNHPAKLWGTAIIGFGSFHYKYASGHEGDAPLIGFSPRKGKLVLYLSGGLENLKDLSGQLGKHKTGKGCLYINKLSDVNFEILKEVIEKSNLSSK